MDNYNNNNYNDETQVDNSNQAPYAPQQGYQQPVYQQPVYQQPVYQQQGYQQNYQQQGYQQPAYQQPVYNQNYQQPAGRVVTPKNLVLCIVLGLLTCGIYSYYWLYTLTEDVNTLSGDPNATSGGMVILFNILTCGIYSWFWLYKQGDRIDQIKASRGIAASNSGLLYLILGLVGLGIVSFAMMQNEINNLCA